MYIRAVVPMYPPLSFVGSWLTTHEFLRHLHDEGHEIVVTAYLAVFKLMHFDAHHEGIKVQGHFRTIGRPDLVIGHVGDDGSAEHVSNTTGAPLVMMVHGGDPDVIRDKLKIARMAVFNSESLREEVDWDGLSIVAHPPIDPEQYATRPGGRVTLVNLSLNKGAGVFWDLVERMPDVQFMGVRGNYGPQMLRPGHANVLLAPATENMRDDVYARTRILLMPSVAETWGRVGIEAACSGIPTIAHPTNGIVESLGDSAIYCDRDDVDAWERAIRRLLDRQKWQRQSTRALRRARMFRPATSLKRFRTAIEEVGACASLL